MTSDTQHRTRTEAGARRRSSAPLSGAAPAARPKKRMDLQGLRALAVGLVILNHAFDWPVGGFVGVDIFFVISGFLMTSLLYREYERTGTIKFFAFYRRRIRRLIPASATVIVATLIGAFALYGSGRLISTAWDGLASLFFVSNWRFAALATDYFAQGAATSPLQHYWSLSLEEQYYLVWPVAVLVLAVLAAGNRRPRVTAALMTFVITAALFLVSVQLTTADTATAYFITPARLWELSVGATVAFCMPLFDRLPSLWRPAIMLLSLAGMLIAAVITPSGQGFPAPWALVAVLSTAVFIAFPWHPEKRSWLNPLDNRILCHLGDISYSLYLWHFPALILITEAFRGLPGDKTPVPAVVSIAITLVVAELSFRFVEETVRRSRWLEPNPKRRAGSTSRAQALGLGAAAVVMVGAVAMTVAIDYQASGNVAAPSTSATPTAASTAPTAAAALAELATELKTALATKSWPELTPPMSDIANYKRDPEVDACSNAKYAGIEQCTWGAADAPHSIVLVGDSTGAGYVPMLRSIVDASNGQLRLTTFAMYACPFVSYQIEGASYLKDACPGRKEMAIKAIAELKPEFVFISNLFTPVQIVGGGKVESADYKAGLQETVKQVAENTKKVVFFSAAPAERDVRECYSDRTSPAECVTSVTSRWTSMVAVEKQVAAEVDGTWIDTRSLYCVSGRCPAFAAGVPVKFDDIHITEEWSRHIAPSALALLANAGVTVFPGAGQTADDATNGDPSAPATEPPAPTSPDEGDSGAAASLDRDRLGNQLRQGIPA